jgi:hypothetical protein
MRDYTGQKYGRLTVLNFSHRTKSGYYWNVRCECGKEKAVNISSLKDGSSASCGCLHTEQLAARNIENKKHGYWGSRTYASWCAMKGRCYTPTDKNYPNYGARGITVYAEWLDSFDNFLRDMGERPPNTTLDRINNNGNYEPGNCAWSTPRQQARNRRSNTLIEFNGEVKTISEWAEGLGITPDAIGHRIKNGWPPEKAVSTRKTNKYANNIS